MRFEEEKYFPPYIPLHRRYSPSPSEQYLRTRSPLAQTLASMNNLPSPMRTSKKVMSPSPSKRTTTEKPIWDLLYEEGLQQRRAIEYKHKQKTSQLDEQCTFKPMLRGKSQRYFPQQQTNFIDRNTIWQENRIKKQVKQREELTSRTLKQCTFTPAFRTKPRERPVNNYNRHARHRQQEKESRLLLPQPSRANFQDLRRNIRSELQNLKL